MADKNKIILQSGTRRVYPEMSLQDFVGKPVLDTNGKKIGMVTGVKDGNLEMSFDADIPSIKIDYPNQWEEIGEHRSFGLFQTLSPLPTKDDWQKFDEEVLRLTRTKGFLHLDGTPEPDPQPLIVEANKGDS